MVDARSTIFNFRYWEVGVAAATLVTNTIHGANYATLLTFTLPTTSRVGDIISIVGIGAGGWTIAQNANQYIRSFETVSTVGVTGTVSGAQGVAVELICMVANLGWIVRSANGTLVIA